VVDIHIVACRIAWFALVGHKVFYIVIRTASEDSASALIWERDWFRWVYIRAFDAIFRSGVTKVAVWAIYRCYAFIVIWGGKRLSSVQRITVFALKLGKRVDNAVSISAKSFACYASGVIDFGEKGQRIAGSAIFC